MISVVVPVYQEEASIRPFLARLIPVLERLGSYEVLFCLDPSPDATERVIRDEIAANPSLGLLVFSRRFGQAAAVRAGVLSCRGDSCVVIDVDLQDPPELIETLHARLADGYDVAYAQRRSRRGESWPKLLVAWLGYKLINAAAEVDIPRDTGDFRIISRRVIEELRRLPESHAFVRGLVAFVGFRQVAVPYDRDQRSAGTGHYNRYLGSLRIGLDGLFGFSRVPLAVSLVLGLFFVTLSIAGGAGLLVAKLVFAPAVSLVVPGFALLIAFFGGLNLGAIGIVGEYLGRMYDELKRRPPYIVDRAVMSPAPEVRAEDAGAAGPGARPRPLD
jgi:glycosyltransferase involved in cell wall biosynthesis